MIDWFISQSMIGSIIVSEKKPCPGKETTHHVTSKGRCYPNKRTSSKSVKKTEETDEKEIIEKIRASFDKNEVRELAIKVNTTKAIEAGRTRLEYLESMEEPTLESVSRKIREAEALGKKPELTPKEMAIRRQYGLFGMS